MKSEVELYDTTLRDGCQREGLTLSLEDKLKIAQRLDQLGIHYIEGGYPGSNPRDQEFFARARAMTWQHATIAAFGSTRYKTNRAEDDPNLQALLDTEAAVCTLVCKNSERHVRDVLGTTLDENLAMIADSIRFLRAHGRRVFYDAEHFFDGWRGERGVCAGLPPHGGRGGCRVSRVVRHEWRHAHRGHHRDSAPSH